MNLKYHIRLGATALSLCIASAASAAPDVDKAFSRWDADGNGTISAEEMQATSTAMAKQSGEKRGLAGDELAAHVERAEKGAPQRFKKFDSDGDGQLSKEEFAAMRAAQGQPGDKGKPAEKAKGEAKAKGADKAKDKKKDK